MARNVEKHVTELYKFNQSLEKDQNESQQRRPLLKNLNTAKDIRRWLPSIRTEIEWNLNQIASNRNYTEFKINKFKQELEKVYKAFVRKALELDPNALWVPGQLHSYYSEKNKEKESLDIKEDSSLVQKEDSQSSEDQSSSENSDQEIPTPLCSQFKKDPEPDEDPNSFSKESLKRSFNSVAIKYNPHIYKKRK